MQSELPAVDRVSQVVARLEQAILRGDYAPGEKLPPERQLCAQLGVSRGVVREALVQLARDEWVCRRQGSGTRVVVPSARPVHDGLRRLLHFGAFDWRDLGAVRMALEAPLVRLAALVRTRGHVAELARYQSVLEIEASSTDALREAYVDFHRQLAAAGGNAVYDIFLAPLLDATARHDGEKHPTRSQLPGDDQEHARILDAVLRRDADEAERAVRDHIARLHKHPVEPSGSVPRPHLAVT